MKIYPAIDLRGGSVVRLVRGDYDRMSVYAQNPAETAQSLMAQGAKQLHVVDLDGALEGEPVNFSAVKSIAQTGLFIEVGGGIRNRRRNCSRIW